MYFGQEKFAQCRINGSEYTDVIRVLTVHKWRDTVNSGTAGVQSCCSESSDLRAFSRIARYLSGGDRVGAKCAVKV